MERICLLKLISPWLILLVALSYPSILHSQDNPFPIDPAKILLTWDYSELVNALGEGEEVVETMYGQEYLAAYRYNQRWFGKDATIEYRFSDENIGRITVTIPHPEVIKSNREDPDAWKDPVKLDSILKANKLQDSIWQAYLRNNPGAIGELQNAAEELTAQSRAWIRLDSLRADSIMQQINLAMGDPLSRDSTPLTDNLLLFTATWVNHGFVCSYRDFNTYTEIGFSVSTVAPRIAGMFNISEKTLVLRKIVFTHQRDKIQVQLLAEQDTKEEHILDQLFLLIETETRGVFLENLNASGSAVRVPDMELSDLCGSNMPEITISIYDDGERSCLKYQVFSLAYGEPMAIFDPESDIHGFYDGQGGELNPGDLEPGCLSDVSWVRNDLKSGATFKTRHTLVTRGKEETIGWMEVTWRNNKDAWEPSGFKVLAEDILKP